MLESIYCCCGLCKTDSRCSEKGLNVTNCSRILQSRSDSWTDPKTCRNWRLRTLRAAVLLANQNTSQRVTYYEEIYWSWRQDLSAVLLLEIPKRRPLKRILYNRRTIIMPETIPNSEQNQVHCTITMTEILIEAFIWPHRQIFCQRSHAKFFRPSE